MYVLKWMFFLICFGTTYLYANDTGVVEQPKSFMNQKTETENPDLVQQPKSMQNKKTEIEKPQMVGQPKEMLNQETEIEKPQVYQP